MTKPVDDVVRVDFEAETMMLDAEGVIAELDYSRDLDEDGCDAGSYSSDETETAFHVWQAALAHAQQWRGEIAAAIHYPDCWDTAAYPTLLSAVSEIGCNPCDCTKLHAAPDAKDGAQRE